MQPSSQDIVNVFGGPIGWETNDYNAQIEASATSAQNGLIVIYTLSHININLFSLCPVLLELTYTV